MKKNIGTLDRLLRIIIGIVLVGLAATDTQPVGVFGWIGVIPLLTAFVSFCPLYSLLGISTCGSGKTSCSSH